jgi:hypothetical protein
MYILICYMLIKLFHQKLTCSVLYVKKTNFGKKKTKTDIIIYM